MFTTDYALQAVKGIKESFDNAATNDLLQYKNIPLFDFETTSEFSETFTSTEGMSGVKEVAEGETPPTLKLEDGYSITLSDKTFAGSVEVTRKMMLQAKDSTTMIDKFIQRQRNQLLKTNQSTFLTNIFATLNDAFTGSSYLAPDTAALCATHTWKSGNTFSNAATAALSTTAVDSAMETGGAFTDPSGKVMPMTYDTIVVKAGSPNAVMAKKLFAQNIQPTQINDINIYQGMFKVIETPYITTAHKNYWFMLDSLQGSPLYVGINNMPYIDEPIVQNNGSVRSNCWGDYKIGINNMPYAIYGSTGAA